MFEKLLERYETAVVNLLGYEIAIHVEEIMLGLGCFFLGVILMAFLAGAFMLRLHSIEDYGKSKLRVIQVNHGIESKSILSKKNLWESFQQILLLSFSPFFTIKHFTQRDAQRTKRFLLMMGILVAIVLMFSVLSICSVLHP